MGRRHKNAEDAYRDEYVQSVCKTDFVRWEESPARTMQ